MVASSGPDSQPDPLAWQYDLKTRRTFLKRCDYPSVGMAQLYKGSIITVYSRQLKIVEYADGFTERHFAKTTQFTVAMVYLYMLLGPSVFSGLLVMVTVIPLNGILIRKVCEAYSIL